MHDTNDAYERPSLFEEYNCFHLPPKSDSCDDKLSSIGSSFRVKNADSSSIIAGPSACIQSLRSSLFSSWLVSLSSPSSFAHDANLYCACCHLITSSADGSSNDESSSSSITMSFPSLPL